jgi:hypothetical protein
MTRIVTTPYRYKRPPRKKMAVATEPTCAASRRWQHRTPSRRRDMPRAATAVQPWRSSPDHRLLPEVRPHGA